MMYIPIDIEHQIHSNIITLV